MRKIPAYQTPELSNDARVEAEAGATYYAAAMLMQGKNCPPHLVQKFHTDFRNEYLSGWFSKDGVTRFPENCTAEFTAPKGDE